MDREVVVNQIEGAKELAKRLENDSYKNIDDLKNEVEYFNSFISMFEQGSIFNHLNDVAFDKLTKIEERIDSNPSNYQVKMIAKSLQSVVKKYGDSIQHELNLIDSK